MVIIHQTVPLKLFKIMAEFQIVKFFGASQLSISPIESLRGRIKTLVYNLEHNNLNEDDVEKTQKRIEELNMKLSEIESKVGLGEPISEIEKTVFNLTPSVFGETKKRDRGMGPYITGHTLYA